MLLSAFPMESLKTSLPIWNGLLLCYLKTTVFNLNFLLYDNHFSLVL